MSPRQAELIIVEPRGKVQAQAAAEFVGRCILYSLDFYFDDDDVLPHHVPDNVQGVRAIVIDVTDEQANHAALTHYRAQGVRVYVLDANTDASIPNQRQSWTVFHLIDMIVMDAGLTLQHTQHRQHMTDRSDDALFNQMSCQMLTSTEAAWYDAPRYVLEGLVDGYELTGDKRYLATATTLIDQMLQKPNSLDNADTVSPLLPMLRVYEHTGDEHLMQAVVGMFDAYLSDTPRYQGCLVNFATFKHQARSEIIWQVCPGLTYLTKVIGNERYLNEAVTQFDHLHVLLHNNTTGLWRHGVGDMIATEALWSRGAGFVLLGLLHMLEQMTVDTSAHARIAAVVRKQAGKLTRLQHDSGFWFTVMDRPDSEFESSGTAWLCAGFERAMRMGILDHTFQAPADRAWLAVKSRVWRGRLAGHNVATTASAYLPYYVKRPLHWRGWAHFAFRAVCERQRSRTTETLPHDRLQTPHRDHRT